jgi:hypothetical protein
VTSISGVLLNVLRYIIGLLLLYSEFAGVVINTCGWVRGEGYNQIKHIAQAFEVQDASILFLTLGTIVVLFIISTGMEYCSLGVILSVRECTVHGKLTITVPYHTREVIHSDSTRTAYNLGLGGTARTRVRHRKSGLLIRTTLMLLNL